MSIGVRAGSQTREIGTPSFLKAFFSTVYVRIEGRNWGSRFPVLMRDLYAGHVPEDRCAAALLELADLRQALAALAPSEVVWDFERSSALPPWGSNISATVTSLANYFVTSDGRDLLDVLELAFSAGARADGVAVE